MMASTAVTSDVSSIVKEKNLREILDGLVVSQKRDIAAFSSGHLNEANLPKPPDKSSHRSWRSATKPGIKLLPKSTLPQSKKQTQHEDSMRQTILNFSMGTAGTVLTKSKTKPSTLAKSNSSKEHNRTSLSKMKIDSTRSDEVLIEELHLPEAMLKRPQYYEPKSKLQPSEDLSGRTAVSVTEQGWSPLPTEHTPRHLPPLPERQFMPSHLDAVTKKDQFLVLKQFETDVLRKQDATEQNVMSGVKAVEHLEAKLHQGLDNLKYNGYGPNFHRLQIYSTVFDDLIQESCIFGEILDTIKHEYDEYIASLLNGQMAKHRVLRSQVEQLRGTTNPNILREQTENVRLLEAEAVRLLDENERLRQEVQAEEELLDNPKEEEVDIPASAVRCPTADAPVDLMDKVEELKVAILEKLDTINHLKTKLRTEYVPSTVCTHLEQCIKETEVEIQKLTSQEQFFDRSIADMEEELQMAIEMADTTEKDARRVWKRITAVKKIDSTHAPPGAGVTTMGPGGPANAYATFVDSDEEQDDELKWGWYIS